MTWLALKAWAVEYRVHLLLTGVAAACIFLLMDTAVPR